MASPRSSPKFAPRHRQATHQSESTRLRNGEPRSIADKMGKSGHELGAVTISATSFGQVGAEEIDKTHLRAATRIWSRLRGSLSIHPGRKDRAPVAGDQICGGNVPRDTDGESWLQLTGVPTLAGSEHLRSGAPILVSPVQYQFRNYTGDPSRSEQQAALPNHTCLFRRERN